MKKKILITLLLFGAINCALFADSRVDSLAVYILNKTIENLQNLKSCSFVANTNYDVYSEELGNVQHTQKQEVRLQFPNKFKINSTGDKGRTALFYDAQKITYYSLLKNHYAQVSLSKPILEAIDTLNKSFGIDFPASDFFYPDFINDLLNNNADLVFLGVTEIGGKNCFHIAGKDALTSFQFWIEEGNLLLPIKLQLVYLKEVGMPRFEANYSNWTFNELYNDAMFSFTAPPNASIINFNSSK